MAALADHTETLDSDGEPVFGLLLDFGPEAEPVLALSGAEEAAHVVAIVAVGLLDLAIAKGQLSHPVDTAAHARGQADAVARCLAVEAVGREVVRGQVLPVVVRRDVVDVRLVAVLRAQTLYIFYQIEHFRVNRGFSFCSLRHCCRLSRAVPVDRDLQVARIFSKK